MTTFNLRLQPTYYNNGFFNVTVDFDGYVRKQEGPIRLKLGTGGQEIEGNIDRHTNLNRTARVYGGAKLRDWFQANFSLMETVAVSFCSDDLIVLAKHSDEPINSEKEGFRGRSEMIELYKVLLGGREDDSKRYWTIFSLMSVINSGLIAGFLTLPGIGIHRLLLCSVGVALCSMWLLGQMRLQGWICWWENKLAEFEPALFQDIDNHQSRSNSNRIPSTFTIFQRREGKNKKGVSTRIIGSIMPCMFGIVWIILFITTL